MKEGATSVMHKSFKSSNFLNVIDRYAKKQKSKITDQIKEFEESELKKAEAEIIEDTNSMIQRELLSVRNNIAIEISHKELSERRKVSLRRKEIMAEIFKECRDNLVEFTQCEEYEKCLETYAKDIAQILTNNDVQLFVKSDDIKYADVIKKSFGRECSVTPDDKILIGGIRGYSEKRGLIADETLDAKLKEQEDWAAENIGVQLV